MGWDHSSLTLLLKIAIVFLDLTFKGLIGPWDNAFINYILDFLIYLGSNAVITAGLSSYKSRFIYYFKITHYQERSSFDKGLIKKL